MPRNKSGSANGGVIGKTNKVSFGKCTVTTKTSSGTITTQPGTTLAAMTVVGGGGAGGGNAGGGGGAGGMVLHPGIQVCGTTHYTVTVGGGGNAA